ncbi:aldose 1-epimerase [Ensifer sp. HO-A22]|uniref:Aldose 1-epimerase n=1 Tax=Ensifer oleiphilus TaxID=2742698 RepID=A0A7Y6Q6W8_9HYPH|nr:aldose 1-epimerase [Ensifer oleiphilus]NVD40149.1 aldose 1-epimerase [Ensifer oleiphilus]
MTADVLQLGNGALSIELSRFGGSILSGSYCGIPLFRPARTDGLASRRHGAEASFPLVPFGNRLEGNSFILSGHRFALAPNASDPCYLHGDGWLAAWEVVSHSETEACLRYEHGAVAPGPYAYDAVQHFRVAADRLSLTLSVTNRSAFALPMGLGHHPFFPKPAGTRLTAKADRFWTERAGHLPDQSGPIPGDLDFAGGNRIPPHWLNNAYEGWDGKAIVEWPELDLCLEIAAPAPFRHFMLYAPEDADFLCFEPMTHLPNGHHLPHLGGLSVLDNGQSLVATMTLSPRLISQER